MNWIKFGYASNQSEFQNGLKIMKEIDTYVFRKKKKEKKVKVDYYTFPMWNIFTCVKVYKWTTFGTNIIFPTY